MSEVDTSMTPQRIWLPIGDGSGVAKQVEYVLAADYDALRAELQRNAEAYVNLITPLREKVETTAAERDALKVELSALKSALNESAAAVVELECLKEAVHEKLDGYFGETDDKYDFADQIIDRAAELSASRKG